MRTLAFFASSLALAKLHPASEPRLEVAGDVEHRSTYTNSALRATFAGEVREFAFTLKGEAGHAHAIPLHSLVKAAKPKVDPRRKHGDLALAVVAEGDDGYAATSGAGDLERGQGQPVWVALDWDDKPLEAVDGSVRLIVPGDSKPARWVHAVRRLRIVNLAPRKIKPNEAKG